MHPKIEEAPQSRTHSKKGVYPAGRARNFGVLQPEFSNVLIKRCLNGVSRKSTLCSQIYFI